MTRCKTSCSIDLTTQKLLGAKVKASFIWALACLVAICTACSSEPGSSVQITQTDIIVVCDAALAADTDTKLISRCLTNETYAHRYDIAGEPPLLLAHHCAKSKKCSDD